MPTVICAMRNPYNLKLCVYTYVEYSTCNNVVHVYTCNKNFVYLQVVIKITKRYIPFISHRRKLWNTEVVE